jgi:hypothetical protein
MYPGDKSSASGHGAVTRETAITIIMSRKGRFYRRKDRTGQGEQTHVPET